MNPFRRLARAQASRLPDEQLRVAWQAISLLLDYPSEESLARHELLRRAVAPLPDPVRMPLGSFLDHLASRPLEDAQRDYVETFDHTRRCCLYLTYFTFGDTRRRGVALVQFKQAFRRSGVELTEEELPDHLGVVLEFGATVDLEAAWKLVNDHRAGIEMLRLALADRQSPWEQLLVALAATLPELDGEGIDAVRRLVEAGPPQEEVGLEPYAIDPLTGGAPPSAHPPTTRVAEFSTIGVRS
ncbi:nitrate reductase molybdenum cofactor assembly chaperone [Intrasporangium sp.]|uniref:nitrate reductase molybdenum cofactor assembly chaperone n=1 Tax=Intrasporangium sp. TaxID=1925024 RepID=UPI00293A0895|nr:nitrate reductase molybdenum cofactor assembly chaperone [Intrasporangium sp.]MDV3223533.1 nitrate reductase molybdenum cofactor assembly chaperone [Intrasporangium sp.]